MRGLFAIFLSAFVSSSSFSSGAKIDTVLQWKTLEFDYESEGQRQQDLDSGFYNRDVPMPVDMDVHYSGSERRIFVTMPRWQNGTPATLTEYVGENSDGTPVLRPYPSWEWHRDVAACKENRLIDVFRIKIDSCGRLWVLDDGKFAGRIYCPPQLVAFDLATNEVVDRITIPQNVVIPRVSELVTPVVDIRNGNCEDTVVYMADCIAPGILTYNMRTKVVSKALHRTMYPNPDYGSYNILGYEFDLMDGVLGMALEPNSTRNERTLFYSAVSSVAMNRINTSVLRNQEVFLENPLSERQRFREYRSRRLSQTVAIDIDKNGIMYFGDVINNSILCWNTKSREYGTYIDLVYENRTTMQFASGIKVINNPSGGQELWVLTCRFQRIATGTLDPADVNFRISMGKIPHILNGTVCENPNKKSYYSYYYYH